MDIQDAPANENLLRWGDTELDAGAESEDTGPPPDRELQLIFDTETEIPDEAHPVEPLGKDPELADTDEEDLFEEDEVHDLEDLEDEFPDGEDWRRLDDFDDN